MGPDFTRSTIVNLFDNFVLNSCAFQKQSKISTLDSWGADTQIFFQKEDCELAQLGRWFLCYDISLETIILYIYILDTKFYKAL